MPYVVTTKRREQGLSPRFGQLVEQSRLAVATLEDHERPDRLVDQGARSLAEEIVRERVDTARNSRGQLYPALDFSQHVYDARTLPKSGGTVGPLPDGTVIEVERLEWGVLARRADVPFGDWSQTTSARKYAEILGAFNARHAS